ncbi:unnamed protein product [Caenorhabditis sp. 36 PRJEB53466]|nr:unnamed protein product [Caenorhabditis sp. 36 PRJEB53466]
MAYVESYYLDGNMENEPAQLVSEEQSAEAQLEQLLADRPLHDMEIGRIVASQQVFNGAGNPVAEPPASDYCGFESDDMPPIYRAQLRQLQKEKLMAKAKNEKSEYAYHVAAELEAAPKEFKNYSVGAMDAEDYVPGFSPPQQNDEIHKRSDISLPKGEKVMATENVFHLGGGSQYVLLPHEDAELVNAPKKSQTESLISYTMSDYSTVLTATLGPALGAFSVHSPTTRSVMKSSRGAVADKYKGLSAFRPVTASLESQYADPELN